MAHLGAKNITQLLTVAVGSPLILEAAQYSIPYPAVIRITPGSGGTITVEDRGSPEGEFHNIPLPIATPGVFSAYGIAKLDGPVEALRLTAAVADGVVEISQ